MKGSLIFNIQSNNIILAFGYKKIILALEQFSINSFQAEENLLQSFFTRNGLTSTMVKNVIVIADLSSSINQSLHVGDNLAYFRIAQSPIEFEPISPIVKNTDFNIHTFNLSFPNNPESKLQIKKTLTALLKLSINKIAINSTYSLIHSTNEEQIIEICEKIYPNVFTYYPSYIYNIPNFLLRENVLLLNYLLFNATKSLNFSLDRILKASSLTVPIYFLKGDGTLVNKEEILKYPLLTKQAEFTSYLLGASYYTDQKDAIVIVPDHNQIHLGLVIDQSPKTNNVTMINNLKLPGKYPIFKSFNTIPSDSKLEEALKLLNPFLGSIPVLNLVKKIKKSPSLQYPLLSLPNKQQTQIIGALNAPFTLSVEKTTSLFAVDMKEKEKKHLLDQAMTILKKNNIHLTDMNHQFEANSLRYLEQNLYFFKLTIHGRLT